MYSILYFIKLNFLKFDANTKLIFKNNTSKNGNYLVQATVESGVLDVVLTRWRILWPLSSKSYAG